MAEPEDDDPIRGSGNVFRDFDSTNAEALMSTDSPTVITLSPDDQKRLIEQVTAPPEPTDGLKRAAKAHAALIRPPQGSDNGSL
ncbi:hypothetical protein FHS82_004060 [Pseudochelatococcus lubricantis]|uniref:Uncharacterized protein n=1 Tax=Pseudochelatococcus lubricantis TaxID=1538102 RepID=A0ABX0V4Q9_9HYPH|nr:DUF1778 domain-containing protein [Pseudochelatococcus lubricantis]NIJ60191.1 hypothetical protein [Pseudochelatococcus lubricantis]